MSLANLDVTPTTPQNGICRRRDECCAICAVLNDCITYNGLDEVGLTSYTDSNYAGDRDDRKSTGAYVFTLAGGAITWSSKRQGCTASSTSEAEYMALSRAARTVKWLRHLLADVGESTLAAPATVKYSECTAALALARNPTSHDRTKHIDVHFHVVRELVERNIVSLRYCPTNEMVADGLTKPLTRIRCFQSRKLMQLREANM
jgi:hypothetical protein